MIDRNVLFGAGLAVFGGALGFSAYGILNNTPLTALGIGIVILGLTIMLTPPHPIPRDVVRSFIKSACTNIEGFLEAMGAVNRAVYIPFNNRVYAYVPLKADGDVALSGVVEKLNKIVVADGRNIGVVLIPPASELVTRSAEGGQGELEAIVYDVLVNVSELAEDVKAVSSGDTVVLEVSKPRFDENYPRYEAVMGSLIASIAAQAIARASNKPTRVISEIKSGDRLLIKVGVLDWTSTAST